MVNTDDALNEAFGRRVQTRARELGIRQADIVRETGAAKSTVNRWFSGARPRGEHLRKLRKVLKVSQEWLDGDSHRPTARSEEELFSVLDNAADFDRVGDFNTHLIRVNNIIGGMPPYIVPRLMLTNVENPKDLVACPVGAVDLAPRLQRGDQAIIERRAPESGDIALVQLPKSAHMYFRVEINPFENRIVFSDNSGVKHEVCDETMDSLLETIVIGRVVAATVRF